jgi:hypothetical protein
VVYLARVATELGDASGAVRAAQIDIQAVVRPSTYGRARGRSISVAWSHDEPHDQSYQDEEQHAHSEPSERTHSVSKATHHCELLLHLPATSRTRPVSRPGAVFAARNHRSPLTDRLRDHQRGQSLITGCGSASFGPTSTTEHRRLHRCPRWHHRGGIRRHPRWLNLSG